jgi:hypothetical protein
MPPGTLPEPMPAWRAILYEETYACQQTYGESPPGWFSEPDEGH